MILVRVAALALLMAGTASVEARPQVELDRVVSRVNSRIVTQGDIWQARLLKLVADHSSDDAARRGLEERILVLSEMSRLSMPIAAPEDDLRERRAAWEASLGGSAAAMLEKAGMSENSLMAWLRDDVRIDLYLKRQFGSLQDAERGKATAEWITRLRQRAGIR